jgi:hypothetical protein
MRVGTASRSGEKTTFDGKIVADGGTAQREEKIL